MGTHKRPIVLEGRRGTWLMVSLMVATYIAVFGGGIGRLSPLEIGVLLSTGVLYSLVSIYDESFRDRLGILWGTVAYFVIQLSLAAAFIYVSRAQGWLIMMPLVSQSVIWLPRRWMEPYVRRRLGKPYRGKRLLSLFELRRMLRSEFGRNFAIRAFVPRPGVARAALRPFEALARPLLPQHNVLAWKPAP